MNVSSWIHAVSSLWTSQYFLYIRTVPCNKLATTFTTYNTQNEYSIKYTRHRTSSFQTCGHQNILLTWIQLTIKSEASLLQERVMDEAIDQQRGRLCACVRTDGRHLEHCFDNMNSLLRITVNETWCDTDYYVETLFVAELTVLYTVKIVASFCRVQYEHIKRGVVGCAHCVCLKFCRVCFYQELAKLDNIWLSYHKYNKKLSYRRETARQLCMSIVYLCWLTDRAMHRTPQNRRGCNISDIQTL